MEGWNDGMMEGWNDGRVEGRDGGMVAAVFHSSTIPSSILPAERFDSRGPEWYKSFIAT